MEDDPQSHWSIGSDGYGGRRNPMQEIFLFERQGIDENGKVRGTFVRPAFARIFQLVSLLAGSVCARPVRLQYDGLSR